MDAIKNAVAALADLSSDTQAKIIATAAIIALALLIRLLFSRILRRKAQNQRLRFIVRRLVNYLLITLGVVALGNLWLDGLKGVDTIIGLLSAGLAVALKDPLTDILGWVVMLTRKQFTIGDRIQVGSETGDLIDIRAFHMVLLEIGNWVEADQSTGRILYVPNRRIFSETVANYSAGLRHIWSEVAVRINIGEDWRKAKSILEGILKAQSGEATKDAERAVIEAGDTFPIHFKHFSPVVYVSIKDGMIRLTARYLCAPRDRRGSEQAVWEAVLDAFAREGIRFSANA